MRLDESRVCQIPGEHSLGIVQDDEKDFSPRYLGTGNHLMSSYEAVIVMEIGSHRSDDEKLTGSIWTVYYQSAQPGEKPCLMGTHWRLAATARQAGNP